jgi:hypothetical protein
MRVLNEGRKVRGPNERGCARDKLSTAIYRAASLRVTTLLRARHARSHALNRGASSGNTGVDESGARSHENAGHCGVRAAAPFRKV